MKPQSVAGDDVARVRAALLSDLDKLIGSWLVDDGVKRRARAVREVLAQDDAVIRAIAARLK